MTDADVTAHATRLLVHAVAACLNVPLSAALLASEGWAEALRVARASLEAEYERGRNRGVRDAGFDG